MSNCINSSKVYCKSNTGVDYETRYKVLIVAKCIVNIYLLIIVVIILLVLIVAKCIVNSN